jgi:restriction endonuclease Mrr
MSIPTYDKFMEPVLRFLAAHPEGALAREANEAAADMLLISSSDRLAGCLVLSITSPSHAIRKRKSNWRACA